MQLSREKPTGRYLKAGLEEKQIVVLKFQYTDTDEIQTQRNSQCSSILCYLLIKQQHHTSVELSLCPVQ